MDRVMTVETRSPRPPGASTFKARDVEELVDFYLHRRVANLVVRLLAPTRVHPDQVTFSSGAVALVAGVVIALADAPWQLALGAALFFCSIVLDCSDGQLARLRGTSSFAGRALDGWVDVVSSGSIILGQFVYMARHDVGFWWPFVLGWATGYAVKWHVHYYDHVKNVYLLNTESEEAGADAYPSLEAIEGEAAEHRAAGRRLAALMARSFVSFTLAQRKTARATAEERRAWSSGEQTLYRAVYRGTMRLWTFNGLGTHLFLLTLATLSAGLDPRAPLAAWLFILAPMSLGMLWLLRRRIRLAARYDSGLALLAPAHDSTEASVPHG
jgi:hypothetical protein